MRLLPRRLVLSMLALALVLPTRPAGAFTLVPMEMEFSVAGRGATRVFRVENAGPEPAAVEISAHRRRADAEGADLLEEADDDFAIFPRQIVLRPGQVQAVRVQWLGRESPERELAYRLIAEQLPLDPATGTRTSGAGRTGRTGGAGGAGGAGRTDRGDQPAPVAGGLPVAAGNAIEIRLLMKYVAALYVVPPNASPQVEVVAVERTATGVRPALRLILENRGTAHALLRAPRLTLTDARGNRRILADTELAALADANLLAGARRSFTLPEPAGLATGVLQATLEGAWQRGTRPGARP